MRLAAISGREGKILSLLIMLSSLAGAQTQWETQLHQMFQIEGTNRQISQFFRSLNIPYKSDTVYVFVVPPMIAARIEGAINPFIKHLRKQGVEEDIILVAVSDKKRAAERYLQRRNFEADYKFVIAETFLNSFDFSTGTLQVPFVAKFSRSSGDLLASYSLEGKTDSSTAASFITEISCPKVKGKAKTSASKSPLRGERLKPVFAKRLQLYDTDDYPLSTTYYISINPSHNFLALMDHMSYYIFIFDLTNGRLLNVLYPDSSEERMFINLPQEIMVILKQLNIINSQYFNHQFSDDSLLLISGTLPKMLVESTSGKDTTVAYYNAPVLIKKKISSNQPLTCISFKYVPDNVKGEFSHTAASIIPETGLLFTPFTKGWPQGSEMLDETRTPPEDNPFTNEFYQEDVYQFAVFDTGGRFIRFLGRLSKQFEDLQLGYLGAKEGLVKFYNNRFYTTDRYTGKIYVYDKEFSLIDSIAVFDNPMPVIPDIDRSKEPLRYLIETFRTNFRRRIVDFHLAGDYFYTLLTEDEQPVLYRQNLQSKEIRRFILPLRFGKERAKYHLLKNRGTDVVTIALLDGPNDQTYYCELKLP